MMIPEHQRAGIAELNDGFHDLFDKSEAGQYYQNEDEYAKHSNNAADENKPTGKKEKKKRTDGTNSMLLTILQIAACIIILAGAYCVRLIGGDIHAAVGTWFYEHYNQSVFTGADKTVMPFVDIAKVKQESVIPGKDKTKSKASDKKAKTEDKTEADSENTSTARSSGASLP